MRSNSQKSGDGGAVVPRPGKVDNGIIPTSFRTLSGYFRIVSSGASTMASTVRSAASAMVEREEEANHDQVLWAGFDKIEVEKDVTRKVLLLAFIYGFQVWDIEVADNICKLVSRHDGPVSCMEMLPRPVVSCDYGDNFAESRPLLIICAHASFSGGGNIHEASGIPCNGSIQQGHGPVNDRYTATVVWFYSLRSQLYVHLLRFRSAVLVVRSSSRIVVVLQLAQIHCLNAGTLERENTILTNPVPTGCVGSGYMGCGPLAVGPRWMAYSGSPVSVSSSGRVIPQHLTTSSSFPSPPSNGSLVARYAKESSKHLAADIITLGDMGYKKLSRYYSELLPEGKNCQTGTACTKVQGVANGHSVDAESVGMVIVRDISSKTLIAQFQAHKSPILSLCFDPSGVLLVTASVQGHNINVFHIAPGLFGGSGTDSGRNYVHLYRLQRGLTNAVIRDISFSTDSRWIMVTSSRGTSHLFVISPPGGLGSVQSNDGCSHARNSGLSLMVVPAMHRSPNSALQMVMQQHISSSGPPVTLSVVSRIRNGTNGWKNTMTGAAAAATGRLTSLPAAVVSSFHSCKVSENCSSDSMNRDYYLLVFSQSGSLVQYALRTSADNGFVPTPGVSVNFESNLPDDVGVTVEAICKWNICQRQNRKELGASINIYGENGNTGNSEVYPERLNSQNDAFSDTLFTTSKEKFTPEERHQMHISEAELQMHEKHNLLARSEIYFQSMLVEGVNTYKGDCGGEMEIEKVPIQTIEVRSKGLVPVFENGRVLDQSDCNVACRSSSDSLDFIADVAMLENQCDNGLSKEIVTTNGTQRASTDSEFVNNIGKFARETQPSFILNEDRNSLKMENQFADNDESD